MKKIENLNKFFYFFVLVLACFLLNSPSKKANAGFPGSSINDEPLIWDTSSPIRYRVDGDLLGQLSEEEALALIQSAIDQWASIEGTGITFEYDGVISEDITSENYETYYNEIRSSTATYDLLIIYDNDGSIVESLGRDPETVAGTAVTMSSSSIQAAIVIINGDTSLGSFQATILHELGHVLGMAHTNLNYQLSWLSDWEAYLPTLWYSTNDDAATLHPDDITTLMWMYEAPVITLSGRVVDSVGNAMESIMVVARNITSPYCRAYGVLTGWPNDTDPGYFEIPVLEAGDYVLEVVQVYTSVELPGGAEFYNEGDVADEEATALSIVHAEENVSDLNIILSSSGANTSPLEHESYIDSHFYEEHPEIFSVETNDTYCFIEPDPVVEEESVVPDVNQEAGDVPVEEPIEEVVETSDEESDENIDIAATDESIEEPNNSDTINEQIEEDEDIEELPPVENPDQNLNETGGGCTLVMTSYGNGWSWGLFLVLFIAGIRRRVGRVGSPLKNFKKI